MTTHQLMATLLAIAVCCSGTGSEGRAQSTLAVREPTPIESLPAAAFNSASASTAIQTEAVAAEAESVPAPAGEPMVGTPLEEFVFLAETGNPALREAAARVQVAQGNAIQAGLYPNPTFYTGSPQWTGSISQYNWFVGQDFITAGKLKLDRSAAYRSVEQAQLELTRTRFEVLTNVRRQFFITAVAQRRVEVLSELLRVSANSRDIGRKLLKAGESNQADAILLEIENDRTEVAYQNSVAALAAARRQLAAVVGIPDMPIDELRFELAMMLPAYEHEALRQGVVDRNALAAVAAVEIRRMQIQLRRAIVQPRPNFNIQAGYQYSVEDPHNDQGIAQLSMSVPLWNRNQGGIRAAQAETARATAALQRVENDLSQQTARALGEYAAAGERVAIYEEKLLPKAREVFRVNQSLFEQGQTDFLRLLQTQRTLIEADLGYLDAQEARWSAAATIAGLLQLEQFP